MLIFGMLNVCFAPKKASDKLLAWEPKDHETRAVPAPPETLQLLVDMQVEADEASPYIFISKERLAWIMMRRDQGKWEPDAELINNLIPNLSKIRQMVCRAILHTSMICVDHA